MPEGTKDAMLLITISWRALGRVIQEDEQSYKCDATVVILFASFYIESTLNYIIGEMDLTDKMKGFFNHRPGMQDKLGWFYNKYISKSPATDQDQLYNGISKKLELEFPGFATIRDFRNDLCHGVIYQPLPVLSEVLELRKQAKEITDRLYTVSKDKGYDIEREETFADVIDW